MSARGGLPAHAPSIFPFPAILSPHRIINLPGHHLSPFQHPKAHQSLHQTPLLTYLPHPRHDCQIPIRALATAEISSNVTLSYLRAAIYRLNGSQSLPPPL